MLTTPLHALDLSRKLFLTLVLAGLAAGYFVAIGCVFHITGMADGRPGLNLDDITYTFYGNRGTTRLKEEVLGSMKRYFSAFEDPTSLAAEEQADVDRVVAWSDAGAPEAEFLRSDGGTTAIRVIFERRGCLSCHAAGATMIGGKKDAPLTAYAGVARFTAPDRGMAPARLMGLSHVHLFGMTFLFLVTGLAVAATLWPRWLRAVLMVGGPLSVLTTVGAWWAVKYGGPAWSSLALLGGVLMTLAFGLSILAALYDLWLRAPSAG